MTHLHVSTAYILGSRYEKPKKLITEQSQQVDMADSLSAPAVAPSIKSSSFQIQRLTSAESVLVRQKELSVLLKDCVTDDFSIGFLSPFTLEEADVYWNEIAEQVPKGNLHLFILTSPSSSSPGSILGSIQLHTVTKNAHLHRGEVVKVLVSPNARRQGIARLLMKHVEGFARSIRRELLTLDSASQGPANEMYRRLGWEKWGTCKGYAKWPDGRSCDATFFRKEI